MAVTKVLSSSQETALWSVTMTLLPTLLGGINGALIMTFGGFSIMDGAMTAGMFVAFQNLMGSFQAPVNSLMGLGVSLQTTEMQMQRLNDVRRYETDSLNFPDDKEERTFPRDRLSGEVTMADVSFGYSPLEPPLLKNFDLHMEPGGWVAVVGASGSGKSTLAKIVTGIYEEWSGTVAFDGVLRRKLPRTVILNSLAAVDQDVIFRQVITINSIHIYIPCSFFRLSFLLPSQSSTVLSPIAALISDKGIILCGITTSLN